MHATELANLRPGGEGSQARHLVFQEQQKRIEQEKAPSRRLLQLEEEEASKESEADENDDDVRSEEDTSLDTDFVPLEPLSRKEKNKQVADLPKVGKEAAAQLTRHHDPYDFAVYAMAEERFHKEVALYGLKPVSSSSVSP